VITYQTPQHNIAGDGNLCTVAFNFAMHMLVETPQWLGVTVVTHKAHKMSPDYLQTTISFHSVKACSFLEALDVIFNVSY
jgi:hypothetical protein